MTYVSRQGMEDTIHLTPMPFKSPIIEAQHVMVLITPIDTITLARYQRKEKVMDKLRERIFDELYHLTNRAISLQIDWQRCKIKEAETFNANQNDLCQTTADQILSLIKLEGYVKLSDDQRTPQPDEYYGDDYWLAQEHMLKANFRRVEL